MSDDFKGPEGRTRRLRGMVAILGAFNALEARIEALEDANDRPDVSKLHRRIQALEGTLERAHRAAVQRGDALTALRRSADRAERERELQHAGVLNALHEVRTRIDDHLSHTHGMIPPRWGRQPVVTGPPDIEGPPGETGLDQRPSRPAGDRPHNHNLTDHRQFHFATWLQDI